MTRSWRSGDDHTVPLLPALLLLYDITNKASFDNIQVSVPLPGPQAEGPREGPAGLGTPSSTSSPDMPRPQAWLAEIQEHAQHDVVLMLLANKVGARLRPAAWGAWESPGLASPAPLCPAQVDSAHERVVKREDGEKLAKVSVGRAGVRRQAGRASRLPPPGHRPAGSRCSQEYGLPFMETSAKTGLNVDLAFRAIAKELRQRSMKMPGEPRFRLHDYVRREGRGASCCRP